MRRRRILTAKRGFTTWALIVYAFLYLPIVIVVIFAFNKPSPTSVAAFHGSNICNIPPANVGNISVWNGFTTCWFSEGLHDSTYIPAIETSLKIAAAGGRHRHRPRPRAPRSRSRACARGCGSRSTSWST